MEARVRRWRRETAVRFETAFEAVVADGRVRRVGSVRALRVYDRPCFFYQRSPRSTVEKD